jgi:hypothetical protein
VLALHQSLCLQPAERFADWNSAHPELARQLLLSQLQSARQFPAEDALAQSRGDCVGGRDQWNR